MPDVNSQITDSVTQVNTKVLGDAPAIAMGNLFVATSQALANAAHNATNNQQQTYVTAQAATTMGVSTLYSLDTAATAKAAAGGPAAALVVAPLATAAATAQELSNAAYRAAIESTDPMLSLMVLDAGALAILDAVTHLQRTAIISEAATTMALTRALAAPDGGAWKEALQAAQDSLVQATAHLEKVGKLAIALHREARG
ncbi:MAG: glycerol-3-phosphate dehydrogenase [Caulobacter sp.]|nr:glycerol-3-phosphate dehydrogenase [Caulobacter sp.]